MKKIHISRKMYIIAIVTFFVLAILGSTIFFFIQVGDKWYESAELSKIEIGNQSLNDIEINGEEGLIYVTKLNQGFDIYDIEDPTDPTLVGNLTNLGGLNRGLFYSDNQIFLLASKSLHIIDVSDPTSPEMLGNYTTYENVQNVWVVDDVAYLMTFNWFRVLDISNHADITELYSLQMHYGDHDIVVRDNVAFVATNLDGLAIFDVTDPSQPQILTELKKYGDGFNRLETYAKAVRLDGDRLYIVDGIHGLVSFDISNISAPVKLFKYVSGTPPAYFAVHDNLVYYPNLLTGIELVDISDPENVELRGITPSRYLTTAVVVYNDIAVSISTEGVSLTSIAEGEGWNPKKKIIALESLKGLWTGIGVITVVMYLLYKVQNSDLLE